MMLFRINLVFSIVGLLFCLSSCRDESTSLCKTNTVTTLTDSLLLWLQFNGTVVDSSVYRFPAILRSVTFGTNRKGIPQSALITDGTTSSYVSLAHDDRMNIPDASNFSVNLWFKYSDSQPEFAGILTKARTESQGKFLGWQICVTNGTQLSMQYGSESQGVITLRSTKTVNDGEWHMLTMNVDRQWNTIYWYIDGKPDIMQTSNFVSNTLLNTAPIQLGIERNMVRPFKGSIDGVRIYRRLLSSGEISRLFNE
jgi:hypothetical protein